VPELSGVQFFDPKPYFTKGGQGKFFADPKPVDEHRYQRGYTPDRMRAVRDLHLDITRSPEDEGKPYEGPAGPRHAWETIARSTTPSEPEGETNLAAHVKLGARASMNPGFAGSYQSSTKTIKLAGRSQTENDEGQVFLHELGHWRSAQLQNPSAQYKTPSQRGREEAFADDNVVDRWRPDPRDVRRGTATPRHSSYEGDYGWQGLGGAAAHGAYIKARRTLQPAEKKDILTYGFHPHGKIIGSFGHVRYTKDYQPGLSAELSAAREGRLDAFRQGRDHARQAADKGATNGWR